MMTALSQPTKWAKLSPRLQKTIVKRIAKTVPRKVGSSIRNLGQVFVTPLRTWCEVDAAKIPVAPAVHSMQVRHSV